MLIEKYLSVCQMHHSSNHTLCETIKKLTTLVLSSSFSRENATAARVYESMNDIFHANITHEPQVIRRKVAGTLDISDCRCRGIKDILNVVCAVAGRACTHIFVCIIDQPWIV